MNRCLTHLSSHGSYPIRFPLLSAGKLAVCFSVDEGHDVFTPVRYKKDIIFGLTISVRDPISVVFNLISFSIGRALGGKRILVALPTRRIVTLGRPRFGHPPLSYSSVSETESVHAHSQNLF